MTNKTIPAGSKKLLLIDTNAVDRNLQRAEGIAQPVGRVAVLAEDGSIEAVLSAKTVIVNGPVSLEYKQHGFIAVWGREPFRAAFVTTAEVVLSDDAESPTAAAPTAKPTKPAKPQKPASVVTDPAAATTSPNQSETKTDGEE